MLPPGYKGAVPEGYYVCRSSTNNVFVFLRGFYEDPKNLTVSRILPCMRWRGVRCERSDRPQLNHQGSRATRRPLEPAGQ
jgi:hypothetical protein